MKTYSQSKQDLFAMLVNNNQPGFFIDIGCSIPSFQSNTKLLLENGWSGICVDIEPRHEEWKEFPKAQFIQGDATKIDWIQIAMPYSVQYASVDVDFYTYDALKNLMSTVSPWALTVEHDAYRFGDALRTLQREFMKAESHYSPVRLDVSSNNCPYEDWWLLDTLAQFEEVSKEVSTW